MILPTYNKFLSLKVAGSVRNISKHVHPDRTSKGIRQNFINFFTKDHDHKFVRSSPVVPFCDPTVAFVNAGMNQFKGIFTGKQEPKFSKVANYQKCVRVGGKHNDLDVVGEDGYHHTFFEMLGNWSFGDYFKRDACEMAWKLLVDVYKIPTQRLYVTYFKGDLKLGLEEDVETKEIWKSLGVSSDRIIPFGMQENFWEMGDIGPCGPCTEIHIDHKELSNRSDFVNKGLFDLTELWNIVFIQYYRDVNGDIKALPNKHVDTGMGLERLSAVLQNKMSNYDTDNFSCLIDAISKISKVKPYEGKYGENDWDNLDASYRILADHSRMITACLSDGMIPEQNQKLRRIMRKCFFLSENVFQKETGLLRELSNYVVDNLGYAYPEMEKNISCVHQIIDYEEEVYKDLRTSAHSEWEKLVKQNEDLKTLDILEAPSLIPALKDLQKTKPKEINGSLGFKLFDTFGLDIPTIEKLSHAMNLPLDKEALQIELNKAKAKSKHQSITASNKFVDLFQSASIPRTDDKFKYNIEKVNDNYEFEKLDAKVLRIICHDEMVERVGPNTFCSLLLDKTNFYSEAGGQLSDKGSVKFGKNTFEVSEIENLNDYILHKGFFCSKGNQSLKVGSVGTLSVDEKCRLDHMRNHTATHLLNAVLKDMRGATCQKSSKVTDNFLNLDISIFGPKLTAFEVKEIEYRINKLITKKLPVIIKEVNSQEFLEMDDITTIPGEIYPEDQIRLIEVNDSGSLVSREPCCGTHVCNTGDLENFSVIKMKSLGRSTVSLHAVTAEKSRIAEENGIMVLQEIKELQKSIPENIDKPDLLNMAVSSLRNKVGSEMEESLLLPVYVKHKCLDDLLLISKQIKNIAKGTLNEFIDMEMQSVLDSKVQTTKSNKKYIIHYLRTSMILEHVPLHRATRLCKSMPIMVISYTDNTVQARCCVPKEFCTDAFTAEEWMKQSVARVFNGSLMMVKGQNEKLVCNMKSKRVNIQDWDSLLKNSLNIAAEFVERNL